MTYSQICEQCLIPIVPTTQVKFFAEKDNVAPALNWMLELDQKVREKFIRLMHQLELEGSTLKRPMAAPLRDKIYELRVGHKRVNYRMLYFFHGTGVAVLCHGCTKESEVSHADIDRAISKKKIFDASPSRHTLR